MTPRFTEGNGGQPATVREGLGSASAHHGEILQGVFEPDHQSGRLQRGLITLPRKARGSRARFAPRPGAGLTVEPPQKVKALRAAKLALRRYGAPGTGGHLEISCDVPEGWGMGSSTSDVVATIRAVADAHGIEPASSEVARLAVAAESASDSTMFEDRAVLFAHREGVVLEDLGDTLPPVEVVGLASRRYAGAIETVKMPPARYDWWEVEAFRPLRALLRKAVHDQDPRLLGRVASASSRINQRHLPKPGFEAVQRVGANVGALGLSVAHSGTVMGLLFDPEARGTASGIARARSLLDGLDFDTWRFCTAET
jgi:uncharacterized protein involved in propanediol utilization